MSYETKRWGHGLAEFGHGLNEIYDDTLVDVIEDAGADETAWVGPFCDTCGAPAREVFGASEQVICGECYEDHGAEHETSGDVEEDDFDQCASCMENYFTSSQPDHRAICGPCYEDSK